MELAALRDLVIIFTLSIGTLLLSHRLRLPAIVGLLMTGVVVGPYGLRLVRDIHTVESLAEVGVILLLFTIGIEFSLEALLSLKRIVGLPDGGESAFRWSTLLRPVGRHNGPGRSA